MNNKNIEYINDLKLYEESGIDESYTETPCNFFEKTTPIFSSNNMKTEKVNSENLSVINAKTEAENIVKNLHTLNELQTAIKNFKLNPLAKFATNPITGTGVENPKLLVIIDTPNSEEDKTGIFPSGQTGELFKKILSAIKVSFESNLFAFPISFFRAPGGRTPTNEEMEISIPFITRLIEILNPQIILTMGSLPTQTLLKTNTPITTLRGQWQKYKDIDLMPTFSLTQLLNNPEAKKKTWEDLKILMKKL